MRHLKFFRPRSSGEPPFSERILATDEPCIVQMQRMLAGTSDTISLAQGIVHWQPPEGALVAASQALRTPLASAYCADDGLPELRTALEKKLVKENGLNSSGVMITAGANQAFMNLVLTLLEEGSGAVLFAPYYFNHLMALQMTGADVVINSLTPELQPDLEILEKALKRPNMRMVVICNPCNPTGVIVPTETLEKAAEMCKEAGVWLIVDNTYEYFTYDGVEHTCVEAPHVINIFSFSKAYGMMGWRVGYLAYSKEREGLLDQLLKAQDTIPICPPVLSQIVALKAHQLAGRTWVKERVKALEHNRQVVRSALEPLGEGAAGAQCQNGAIYMWVKLPEGCEDDKKVVEWLAKKHSICLIPGSSCGLPGHVRVAFANMPREQCAVAAQRLKAGLSDLVAGGMAANGK
ncbi:hypothetical protein CYMTET_11417 [Cymbomonas tetramitiformis]|uniref:Aminotransferase class I/classII large domain-containing protein n=1 Tax=Cymbomonas tetramitiformis TaxID=36881 RepID=A0AAE0LDH4_9CHLO|nr:hypothetical protein CYMTET_11417 [Cymbomonas tetramitiformis]